MIIFNEQMEIINKIIEIRNSRPDGYNTVIDFEIWSLCHQLEKLGTEPIIAEKERFRKMYLKQLDKNIPNLNELGKHYESKH